MRFLVASLTAVLFAGFLMVTPAQAASLGLHEVIGVEEGDMLKLRAGPGTGYDVIVGLPNGTVLRVESCERTGSTRWCKVALDKARGLRGFVSAAYLQKL